MIPFRLHRRKTAVRHWMLPGCLVLALSMTQSNELARVARSEPSDAQASPLRSHLPARNVGRNPEEKSKPASLPLLREGAEILEEVGVFLMVENRVVFAAADGNRRLIALENLCLERVARSLADNPSATNWVVSGTATEFRGGNYLLLRRATVVSRRSPEPVKSATGGEANAAAPPGSSSPKQSPAAPPGVRLP